MSLNRNLTKAVKTIRVLNAVVAGTTDQTSSAVDTRGFLAVRFIALLGALTGTQVTKLLVQQSSDDGVADAYVDVTGAVTAAAADADGNKMLIVDIYKPRERYLKAIVDRGTANAVIDGVICELHCADFQPITADTSVSQQVIVDNPGP